MDRRAKTLLQSLLIAGLFGVIGLLGFTGSTVYATFSERAHMEAAERAMLANLTDFKDAPIDERILAHENVLANLKTPDLQSVERRELATLYVQAGYADESEGNYAQAEDRYARAIALDPTESTHSARIAGLYTVAAQHQPRVDQRLELWENSASYWRQAITLESSPETRETYVEQATDAYLNIAADLNGAGYAREAAARLRQARELAASNPETLKKIEKLEDKIGS